MTDDLVAQLSDHERIWLQNEDDAKNQCEGRLWCEDKVWPDDPEDGEPTEYIRADLYAAAEARVRELEAELYLVRNERDNLDDNCKRLQGDLAEVYERAANVADCYTDKYGAVSFTSINADQVLALRSKEQAAHEIATAIRNLAQEVKS